MDHLRYLALAAMLVLGTVAGGAAVRIAVSLADLRIAAVVGLLALLIVLAALTGTRGRLQWSNPYW